MSKKVVDINSYRKKSDSGSVPKNPGSPHFKRPESPDEFQDRLLRIRTSLEKINQLMSELRKMSREQYDRDR